MKCLKSFKTAIFIIFLLACGNKSNAQTIKNVKKIGVEKGISYFLDEAKYKILAYKNNKVLWDLDLSGVCGNTDLRTLEIKIREIDKENIEFIFGKNIVLAFDHKDRLVDCVFPVEEK